MRHIVDRGAGLYQLTVLHGHACLAFHQRVEIPYQAGQVPSAASRDILRAGNLDNPCKSLHRFPASRSPG